MTTGRPVPLSKIAEETVSEAVALPRAPNRSNEELSMRALLVPEMRKRWPGARIIHELPLRYSEKRIDLAAITETEIISVEIKSSRDTLDRLHGQVRGFVPVSDLIVVALAPGHWTKEEMVWEEGPRGRVGSIRYCDADRILQEFGYSIGVWLADTENGRVQVERDAYDNKPGLWSAQLLDLLHVAELINVASAHRVAVGKKRPDHRTLVRACHDVMSGREVKRAVCAALRARSAFDKASDAPRNAS